MSLMDKESIVIVSFRDEIRFIFSLDTNILKLHCLEQTLEACLGVCHFICMLYFPVLFTSFKNVHHTFKFGINLQAIL